MKRELKTWHSGSVNDLPVLARMVNVNIQPFELIKFSCGNMWTSNAVKLPLSGLLIGVIFAWLRLAMALAM